MKNWRINLFFILIIIFGAAIISRLIYLQIFQSDYYMALAQGQKNSSQLSSGRRGAIFFSGGQVLANSVKNRYAFVSPKNVLDKEKTAETLSSILGLEKNAILARLQGEGLFEIIKEDITDSETDEIKKNNLKAVYLEESFARKYPQGKMASQTVGFLGGEGSGQYGLEEFYNEFLRAKDLSEGLEDIAFGFESNNGADIFLTIDYNIQRKAEQLLEDAKKDFDIKSGLIIVLEPTSGKILALANYPNFDPNKYSEVKDYKIFQNPSLQSFYEPGSVFKVITMAAALDQGKITPETTYVDPGVIKIGQLTISNFGNVNYGKRTMTEVWEKSINTGVVFAERKVGHDVFLEYIRRFGFFEPTRVDLEGEIFSENNELKKGREINFATASFGQGIEVTPFQMAKAFSAIANGGKLVKPYIVEKIVKDGKIIIKTKPEISKNNIISQETARTLSEMLITVVEKGFAKYAKVDGYNISGKTGTSQVPFSILGINKRGYSAETWQSFIGFAPSFNPKFLALIKLDNPKTKTSEVSAAPIFGKLAEYLFNYLEIPPDNE